MPLNQTKKYPELLDILSLSEKDRTESLKMIFKRDIEENPNLNFRNKKIYPIQTLSNGKKYYTGRGTKYAIALNSLNYRN